MLLIQKQGEILSGKFKVQDLMEPSILVFLLFIVRYYLACTFLKKVKFNFDKISIRR